MERGKGVEKGDGPEESGVICCGGRKGELSAWHTVRHSCSLMLG
jgi:hypothetical protein